MRNVRLFGLTAVLFLAAAVPALAQQEVYTGTIISFPSGMRTRTLTGTFTLRIDRETSDERANRLLGLLQEGDQTDFRRVIDDETVGTFSVDGRIGPRLNVVRDTMVDGKRRIFAVFERWTSFAELRGGYRSVDYPYGVIEMYIDPRTGKGEGTLVSAAKIRWRQARNGGDEIEIENFATFPARLMGVTLRGDRR